MREGKKKKKKGREKGNGKRNEKNGREKGKGKREGLAYGTTLFDLILNYSTLFDFTLN